MQKMLYDSAAYIVTFYYDNLEAYRSDRFTGFQPQPAPDGSLLFQYGTASYQSIRPVTEEDAKGGGAERGRRSGRGRRWQRGGHRGARGGAGRPWASAGSCSRATAGGRSTMSSRPRGRE